MSPASRYEEWLSRLTWISPVVLVGAVVLLLPRYLTIPAVQPGVTVSAPAPAWPSPPSFSTVNWSMFHNRAGNAPSGQGPLAGRFRLAGTFFEFGGPANRQKAILHDLKNGGQHIVSENAVLDDVTVVRIFRDRVILRVGAEEEELWLEFARGRDGVEKPAVATAAEQDAADWLSGRQVGEDRWVYQRTALLDYYAELMNDPERIVAVFDSLKPLYGSAGNITGYQLGIEGEAEFFNSIGLKEGDVVRKVNSMAMTSRRRAEYFIREFVGDRANAFVLDVERKGQRHKLIYEVR